MTICLCLVVAPAAGAVVGEVADLDAVAELAREFLERRDQVSVAVALDRLRRRGQRDGLGAGQRVGLRDVKDRHGAEEDPLLAGLLAVVVALLDRDRREDLDRLLALAHAAVEREEGAEARDVAGGDAAGMALDRDQPLVAQAVAGEAVGGADADPALPAVAGQQRAGGLLDALAVGLAARVALGLGQGTTVSMARHRGCSSCSRGLRPVRGPISRRPHARQGVPSPWRVGPRAGRAATRRPRGPRPSRCRPPRRSARPCAGLRAVDGRQRDHAVADQLLGALGSSRIFHARRDTALGPAERLGGAVLGQAAVEHRAHGLGLLVRVELLARDVLHRAVGVLGLGVADDDRHLGQARASARPRCGGSRRPARSVSPSLRTTTGTSMPCSAIDPASACTCASSSARTFSGHADLLERDLAPGLVGWSWTRGPPVTGGPPRWRADPPPPARPPGRAILGWRVGRRAGGVR